MGTSKDSLVDEVSRLEQDLDDLRSLNKDMSEALNQALDQNNKITKAFHDAFDVVSDTEYRVLETRVEDLEKEVSDLKWSLENEIPDDYDMIDTVTESTRFESVVEDLVKETLRNVVLRLEDV